MTDHKVRILNEVSQYAKAIGLKFTGNTTSQNGTMQYEVENLKGEKLFTVKSSLKKGHNPFNHSRLKDLHALCHEYCAALNLIHTGVQNNLIGNNKRFEVQDPLTNKTAFTSLSTLKAGQNPFTRLSIQERVEQVATLAKMMGLRGTGKYKKQLFISKSVTKFELEEPKTGKRSWITLSNLKLGQNPFNKRDAAEMMQQIHKACAEMNIIATGQRKKDGCTYRYEVLDENGQSYFALGSNLLKLQNPFHRINGSEQTGRNLKQQIEAVKKICEERGWLFNNNFRKLRKNSSTEFEVISNCGTKVAWRTLGNLEKGKDPFKVKTRGEQLAEASELALKIGLVATGETIEAAPGSGQPRQFYVRHTDGRVRAQTLNRLREGANPFTRPTLEEQLVEVSKLARSMNLISTGKHNNKTSNQKKFEILNPVNKQVAWCTLSGLRNGNNPWQATFKRDAPAKFYLLWLQRDMELYLGFGITQRLAGRMYNHKVNLAQEGFTIVKKQVIDFRYGFKAHECEQEVIRSTPRTGLQIEGFIRESTTMQNLDKVYRIIHAAVPTAGSVLSHRV